MRNAIRNFLDLSYTPSWSELAKDFLGAVSAFMVPVVLVLWFVALGVSK